MIADGAAVEGLGLTEGGRIRKEHESLGRHLTASVASGLTFRYAPERDPGWLT